MVGTGGAGNGVDALVIGEVEETDTNFLELALDLGFASDDLFSRHEVRLGEKYDDVSERSDLAKILNIYGAEACGPC